MSDAQRQTETKPNPVDVLQADFGKVEAIQAELTPAQAKLSASRAYMWKLLGVPTFQLGSLQFSKPVLAGGGAAAAFLLFMYLSAPVIAIAAGLVGVGLAVAWTRA